MHTLHLHSIPDTHTLWAAIADATQIVVNTGADLVHNEIVALRGHRADLAERFGIAREAQDVFELIDSQLDLLHETRRRLAKHQQNRHATLLRMRGNLACVGQQLRQH